MHAQFRNTSFTPGSYSYPMKLFRERPNKNPFVSSRHLRQIGQSREYALQSVRKVGKTRWFHTAGGIGLAAIAPIQYVGYQSVLDSRWFVYPLLIGVTAWVAVNLASPMTAPLKTPLSWEKFAFLGGLVLLLTGFATASRSGLNTIYAAAICDLAVLYTALHAVGFINYVRLGREV